MDDQQLEILVEMASNGIERDDLRITPADGEYRVNAGNDVQTVSAIELKRLARNELSDYVTNWYFWDVDVGRQGSAGWTFLRWLEKANKRPVPERYECLETGTYDRTWGQVSVTVRLNERGERRYALTHLEDQEASLDELELHVDPLDARDIAKYTDHGEYRPLKGAPDLQTGWVFSNLNHEKLIRTIDFLYPSSVANWHRDQNNSLDITHYRDAADRHTGIYQVIENLSSEGLNTLVKECCTDSNCIKRRCWQETSEKAIPVHGGNGEIPCREPCPLFIDQARKTVHESTSKPQGASS